MLIITQAIIKGDQNTVFPHRFYDAPVRKKHDSREEICFFRLGNQTSNIFYKNKKVMRFQGPNFSKKCLKHGSSDVGETWKTKDLRLFCVQSRKSRH